MWIKYYYKIDVLISVSSQPPPSAVTHLAPSSSRGNLFYGLRVDVCFSTLSIPSLSLRVCRFDLLSQSISIRSSSSSSSITNTDWLVG